MSNKSSDNEEFLDDDDLEHIIEGDDHAENNQNQNFEETEVENNEETKKKVEIKRRTLNPQPKLNAERLKGVRGISILENVFEGIDLKGKGHEKEDLDKIMGRLEHWAHRLFPRYTFDDCLDKIEKLGTKRPVQNYLRRIRLGMEDEYTSNMDDQNDEPPLSIQVVDPFDELVGQGSSQPVQPTMTLSSEQRERMLRNRLLAEERRLVRMKAHHEKQMLLDNTSENNMINESAPEMHQVLSINETEIC
uniref:TIMELESS-interacting protein n=2 Tax=Clastoptera arizonana TaxID=38151 RepID=A0A1B6C5C2_9HEMI